MPIAGWRHGTPTTTRITEFPDATERRGRRSRWGTTINYEQEERRKCWCFMQIVLWTIIVRQLSKSSSRSTTSCSHVRRRRRRLRKHTCCCVTPCCSRGSCCRRTLSSWNTERIKCRRLCNLFNVRAVTTDARDWSFKWCCLGGRTAKSVTICGRGGGAE